MSKMSKEENAVYMKAFQSSKAKTVKERMAAGDAAVASHRKGPAPTPKKNYGERRIASIDQAVDGGIADGNAQNRKKND